MWDFANAAATFVMAHWRDENDRSREFLDRSIDGILSQTDTRWQIVIVDDFSPCEEAVQYLYEVKKLCTEKIHIILRDSNGGPGIARNIGIAWAHRHRSPFVLFNDADDISHPKRLETVRRRFCDDPDTGVVYSTFQVIDENGALVDENSLTQSILEILEGHRANPAEGDDAWIAIGTEKGYTNLTSSTAVRTDLAYRYPFPDARVSEDQHAWLRYSAGGGKYVYAGDIPSLYRIPQGKPTESRARIGGYYLQKAAMDTQGFLEAMKIADRRKAIPREKQDELLVRFYIKLAETLAREKQDTLAMAQIEKASAISEAKTREILCSRKTQGTDDRLRSAPFLAACASEKLIGGRKVE